MDVLSISCRRRRSFIAIYENVFNLFFATFASMPNIQFTIVVHLTKDAFCLFHLIRSL